MITSLVTGGAGFIGSHIADALLNKGQKVCIVDNLSTGKKENVNPKAVFYELDIESPQLSRVFQKEKPQFVFHCAAQIDVRASVKDPLQDARTNILGSLNVLEQCKTYLVKKIIFTSTGGAIYGDADVVPTSESYLPRPISPYGIAKLAVEHYLEYYFEVFKIPFLALRLANVYGPRQNSKGEAGVVAIFADAMLAKKKPVIFGSGKQTRDFVYVEDVVQAALAAFDSTHKGIFNIGTAKETSVNQVFDILKAFTGFKGKKLYASAKEGEQQRSCLSFERAKTQLKWKPLYDIQEGLEKTVEFYRTRT